MASLDNVCRTYDSAVAIASAFREAAQMARIIFDRYRGDNVPPEYLEDSLDLAALDIDNQIDRGIQRFGDTFRSGDDQAELALLRVGRDLDRCLLAPLRDARDSHCELDYNELDDNADRWRAATVTILRELRERIPAWEKPGSEISTLDLAASRAASRNTSRAQSVQSHRIPPQPLQRPHMEKEKGFTSMPKQSPPVTPPFAAAPKSPKRQAQPLIARLWKPRKDSVSSDESMDQGMALKEKGVIGGPAAAPQRSISFRTGGGLHEPRGPVELEGISMDGIMKHRLPPKKPIGPKDVLRHMQWLEEVDSSTSEDPGPSWPSPSTDELERPDSATLGLEKLAVIDPSTYQDIVEEPKPDNYYLGFCKGAWKMQTGLYSFINAPNRWVACPSSKCSFADKSPPGEVFTSEKHGIRLRWAFLAKSHAVLTGLKDDERTYMCIFCAMSRKDSGKFKGTESFLDHLATHRGEGFSPRFLARAKCINARIAEDNEKFDVNLQPLTVRESLIRSPPDSLRSPSLSTRSASRSGNSEIPMEDHSEAWPFPNPPGAPKIPPRSQLRRSPT